jgi:hypothetical protein
LANEKQNGTPRGVPFCFRALNQATNPVGRSSTRSAREDDYRYWPRRPDLADVECGFAIAPGAAARVGICGLDP